MNDGIRDEPRLREKAVDLWESRIDDEYVVRSMIQVRSAGELSPSPQLFTAPPDDNLGIASTGDFSPNM